MATKKSTGINGKRLDRRTLNKGRVENLKPFVKDDPRINRAGRPKVLSDAYKRVLASIFPPDMISPEFMRLVEKYAGEGNEISYAERIALGQAMKAAGGDTHAAREVRESTEGLKVRTWRDEVIDLLRAGTITPDQLKTELDNDELTHELIIAAGVGGITAREDRSEE